MPNSVFYSPAAVEAAIAAGNLTESDIDAKAIHILTSMYALGTMDVGAPQGNLTLQATSPLHNELALQFAEQSTVLLQNNGNLLPLSPSDPSIKSIAIFGEAAVLLGWGSGGVIPPYLSYPYDAIHTIVNGQPPAQRLGSCSQQPGVSYNRTGAPCIDGASAASVCAGWCMANVACNAYSWFDNMQCNSWGSSAGGACYLYFDASVNASDSRSVGGVCPPAPASVGPVKIQYVPTYSPSTAAAAAAAADLSIILVGTTSSESFDRSNLSLPLWQDAVAAAVAQVSKRSVAIARCPGACFLPWSSQVDSILFQMLPGQEGGNAAANAVYGLFNPSGKLTLSFPRDMNSTWLQSQQQYPGIVGAGGFLEASYSEESFFGYRWYDSNAAQQAAGVSNASPAWPFGHGLSYSNWTYSNLQVSNPVTPYQDAMITVQLQNNGPYAGSEVPQLYVSWPAGAGGAATPVKQLKAFDKVKNVPSGDTALATFTLGWQDLAWFDVTQDNFVTTAGSYSIVIGASSQDIRLAGSLTASGA